MSGALALASVPSVPQLTADWPRAAHLAAACLRLAWEGDYAWQVEHAATADEAIAVCDRIGHVLPQVMGMWDGNDLVRKQLACQALGACRDAALAGLRGDILGSQSATMRAERLSEESRALQGGGGL